MIGRTIAGRYRVERRIARGGMGVVYVATHLRLQRPVVFKVLSEHLEDEEKASARFEQEALGLSRLNHPNVVTVHDFGVEDGVTYIVMEYVPGLTLSDILRRDGVMTFERFLPLGAQIIEAIGAAHQKNIVHRDIKPANIMVVSEPGEVDQVKVLDFGLARLTSSSLDITKDNLVGTVSYVAPEVVKGSRAGKASDVYALGVLFYFLLTGRKPFKAEDDLSVLYKHVHDAHVSMSELLPEGTDVPPGFVDLIDRCLDKEPSRRPADGRELLEELSEIVALPPRSRIASGEFVPAPQNADRQNSDSQNAGRQNAEQRRSEPIATSPGPAEPGAVPTAAASNTPRDLSFELTSMALRDRPNSRWGIPLIALCVFAAGVAAILLLGPADPNEEPSTELSAPTPLRPTSKEEVEVEPPSRTVSLPEPSSASVQEEEEEAAVEVDEEAAPPPHRKEAASKRDEEDLVEEVKNSPEQEPDPPIKAETAEEKPADAQLFAPDDNDSQLLQVDDSEEEVLLPVD